MNGGGAKRKKSLKGFAPGREFCNQDSYNKLRKVKGYSIEIKSISGTGFYQGRFHLILL